MSIKDNNIIDKLIKLFFNIFIIVDIEAASLTNNIFLTGIIQGKH